MKMPGWWDRRSGWAKTVAVLSMLLFVQISLCAVLPSNEEFGRSALLAILFIATLALLIAVLVAWLFTSLFL